MRVECVSTDLDLARLIDSAVLKPAYTRDEALREMEAGLEMGVHTLCVRPCDLAAAVDLCAGSSTLPGAVVGFPHGVTLSAAKADETRRYLEIGAREVDMVANYGAIRSGLWDLVTADIAAVTAVTAPAGVPVKVILETSELTLPQIERAVEAAVEAGAAFVKTSTGFASGGATAEAVSAMVRAAAGRVKVKASGGIRPPAQARGYLDQGAARLGVGSTSVAAVCGLTAPAPDGGY